MFNLFLDFERFLGRHFGYDFVVHFEDVVLVLSGMVLGGIALLVLSGKVVFKLHKVSNLGKGKFKLMRVMTDDGKNTYVADPHNVGEAMETLLIVIFRPYFTYKNYTYRDEKRTKIFVWVLCVVSILILILAVLCITTVLTPDI